MPVRKPLPSIEVEICRRVRLVREAARFSRPRFGRFLAVDSSKLSNIENFRIALDYITGNALCLIFKVSPSWLATGEGRPTQVLPASVYSPIAGATGRTLFSQAVPHLLERAKNAEQILSKQNKAIVKGLEKRERQGDYPYLSPIALERAWQEEALRVGASERMEIDAGLATAVFGQPFTVEFENELAIVSGFDDRLPMREVPAPSDLIDRVRSLTQERGAKSQLARNILKVSRQRLNEWLSGRSMPSARYMTMLLNWTMSQETKKKRGGITPK